MTINITNQFINNIKRMYPIGEKIRLISIKNEPQMPSGLEGIIETIDGIGQIHVKWDNGSSLALNIDADEFELIETSFETSSSENGPGNQCNVRIGNAHLVAYEIGDSVDDDYKGIRIEYVADDDLGLTPFRPAVSLEMNCDGELETRIYGYNSEDPIEDFEHDLKHST
ncbi:DUF4314 domain-containing protein [bacterium]|nr:DUF4314 domain-containing protein [bacterium]